jgi:tetratricopeptide (TPR) repeat protein
VSLSPGARLGPYEIVAPLGAGGMGEVYRARDTRLGRDVAVKVLRESLASGTVWKRFEREARAASALNHPNICAVYDVGEAEGLPYLVMELLEGQTLHDYAGRQPAQPAVAIALGAQIVDALEAAHAKGIIHRDIKAGNIMVTGRRHVKVLDFGLAKYAAEAGEADDTRTMESLTATGTVVGTPHYMAPEILQGKPADARSDLWALGVVLHEMLTGGLPFQGSTAFEVTSAILRQAPPPLPAGVPSGLRTIVERCLEKQPEKRYQNAGEVRAALETPQTAAATSGRKRWLWTAVAVAVLAVAGVWLWQQQPARPQPRTVAHTSTGGTPSAIREANEAFELAMAQLNQGNTPRAQELFQRAVALDSHFAAAHQFLGITYDIQVLNGESNDANLFYKADEELRRALQEDPSLLDVHAELAGVAFMQGDKQRALAELNQLLPRDPRVQGWRLNLHYMAEENGAAKELALNILDRDPLFQPARNVLTEILLTEGDAAGALRHARTLGEQAPNAMTGVISLSWVYMATGELNKARKLLEEKRALLGHNYTWRLAWAVLLALENKREEALRAMDEETLKWVDANFFVTLHAAEFYAVLGNTSKAIEWLDRAVRKGDERVEWFRKNPRLASIRNDPGFQRIIYSIQARRKPRQGK